MAIQAPIICDSDADKVYLSPWLQVEFPDIFSGLTALLHDAGVACESLPGTNDLWCRDYMPIQLSDTRFVCYNYYPDYLRKRPADRKYITDPRAVCQALGLDAEYTGIIIDGGNVVKAGNRIIMTEKVYAENPNYARRALWRELERLFGCELLFLPWDRAEKYGHADGIVKALADDAVLMTNYADFDRDFAASLRKRLASVFHVETLRYPGVRPDKRSWAYINFLTVGKLLVVPQLGIGQDALAMDQIREYYADCRVLPLHCARSIAAGGALNCMTWCRKTEKRAGFPKNCLSLYPEQAHTPSDTT